MARNRTSTRRGSAGTHEGPDALRALAHPLRERWWRAAHEVTEWSPAAFLGGEPGEAEAARQFMRRVGGLFLTGPAAEVFGARQVILGDALLSPACAVGFALATRGAPPPARRSRRRLRILAEVI